MASTNSQGIWAGGQLQYLGRCPACDSSERHLRYSRLKDWTFECSDDEWTLWCCDACHALYLDPRPDTASLPYAYRRYYTHESNSEVMPTGLLQRFLWAAINGYLNRRFDLRRSPDWAGGYWVFQLLLPLRLKLDYFGRHLSKPRAVEAPPQLLDIGCGNGMFLLRARDMGWAASGVEIDPEAVQVCRAEGLEVYMGTIDDVPDEGRYDAITVSHTLEHLPDPREFLHRCHGLLSAAGLLWIAIPNPVSLGHRLFGSAWRGLEPPRHLCLFPPDCLLELLHQAGFRHVKLLRRGAHSPRIFLESADIARRSGKFAWSPLRVGLLRIFADLLASVSSRFGEELVVVAYR